MHGVSSRSRLNNEMVADPKLTYERSKNDENNDFSDFQFDFTETSGRYQGSIILSPLHQNDNFSDLQSDFTETSGRYQGSILLSPLHQNES